MTTRILTAKQIEHIQERDLPMIVLTDNLWSWFSWRIKRHTHGYYNHAMVMHRPGFVVSQDRRLRVRPITDYLAGGHRVKLWEGNWTPLTRAQMQMRIALQLRKPDLRYDWLGIIGQRLGIPWLNTPGRFFCSEHVASILRCAEPVFQLAHPSPAAIDSWCKSNPQAMQVHGIFDPSL